jgi:hypothetical protein
MKEKEPIFIDIDGTLTDDPRKAMGKPVWERIEKVIWLISIGEQVILWSAGGETYAREFARDYGIKPYLCLSKPCTMVDDKPTIRTQGNLKIMSPEEFMECDPRV